MFSSTLEPSRAPRAESSGNRQSRASWSRAPLPPRGGAAAAAGLSCRRRCWSSPASRTSRSRPRFATSPQRATVAQLTEQFNEASGARPGRRSRGRGRARPEPTRVPRHPEMIANEGYHPSAAGYARWSGADVERHRRPPPAGVNRRPPRRTPRARSGLGRTDVRAVSRTDGAVPVCKELRQRGRRSTSTRPWKRSKYEPRPSLLFVNLTIRRTPVKSAVTKWPEPRR